MYGLGCSSPPLVPLLLSSSLMPSRRGLARIAVMQTLFELDFARRHERAVGENPAQILLRNIDEYGVADVDVPFSEKLLQNTLTHHDDIEETMQEHAPQWPLERMDPITRSTLMMGTGELLYGSDAPPAVIMDEAIEIAKEFGEGESGKFVNGVLNAIAHG